MCRCVAIGVPQGAEDKELDDDESANLWWLILAIAATCCCLLILVGLATIAASAFYVKRKMHVMYETEHDVTRGAPKGQLWTPDSQTGGMAELSLDDLLMGRSVAEPFPLARDDVERRGSGAGRGGGFDPGEGFDPAEMGGGGAAAGDFAETMEGMVAVGRNPAHSAPDGRRHAEAAAGGAPYPLRAPHVAGVRAHDGDAHMLDGRGAQSGAWITARVDDGRAGTLDARGAQSGAWITAHAFDGDVKTLNVVAPRESVINITSASIAPHPPVEAKKKSKAQKMREAMQGRVLSLSTLGRERSTISIDMEPIPDGGGGAVQHSVNPMRVLSHSRSVEAEARVARAAQLPSSNPMMHARGSIGLNVPKRSSTVGGSNPMRAAMLARKADRMEKKKKSASLDAKAKPRTIRRRKSTITTVEEVEEFGEVTRGDDSTEDSASGEEDTFSAVIRKVTVTTEDGLPPGWLSHAVEGNASGKVFYHNATTNETLWTHPKHSVGLAPGWTPMAGKDGYIFFHNNETGAASWEKPLIGDIESGETAAAVESSGAGSHVIDVECDDASEEEEEERPLPPGWQAVASKSDGRTFYHNDATGEKSWTRPTGGQAVAKVAEVRLSSATSLAQTEPLPPGWQAVASKSDGRTFYHNDSTGEKAWVRPTAAAPNRSDGARAETAVEYSLSKFSLVLKRWSAPRQVTIDPATGDVHVDGRLAAARADGSGVVRLADGSFAVGPDAKFRAASADDRMEVDAFAAALAKAGWSAGEEPLPPGWQAVASKSDGRTFYHNDATGEKVWERPAAEAAAEGEALPPGWVAVAHDDGGEFYHHAATGETVWTRPGGASGGARARC
jgi:outer membrane protein assembly factor BamB